MNRRVLFVYMGVILPLVTAVWLTRGPLQISLLISEILFAVGFNLWYFGRRKNRSK